MTLMEKIQDKSAKVLIIGGGYVGLPLGVRCAEEGFDTTIYDLDKSKIDSLNNGKSYIIDISDEQLSPLIGNKLTAINNLECYNSCNNKDRIAHIIVICVPTPLNKIKDPDVSFVVSAAKDINKNVLFEDEEEKLVILESTVYPGFTKEVLKKELLQDIISDKYHIAFSPERVDPGNKKFNIKNTPKIVGGIDEISTELSFEFYNLLIDIVVKVSSCDAAEMVKILENTFRLINIGLVNEMALACKKLDIDIWEVIDAANTKPYGFMKFTPGPGVGGHCIPLDPHYLVWKLRHFNYSSKFIELASAINSQMPKEIVNLTTEALNSIYKSVNGSNILIVGVSYKPNIDDVRESPALDIIELLRNMGAIVHYYDPLVPYLYGIDLYSLSPQEVSVHQFDCGIVVANHNVIDYKFIKKSCKTIVDPRNVFTKGKDIFKL